MKIRTRLLVLNKFQRWFFLNFVFYVSTSLLVVGLAAYVWIKIAAAELMKLAGLIQDPAMSLIRYNAKMGITIFAILCVTLLVFSVLQAFFFSRKIAGPVFALTKHLEKCEQSGRLEHANLRKDDLFIDLAETFNRVADKVNSKSFQHVPEKTSKKKVTGLARFGRS